MPLTNQEIFNIVSTHLIKQGKQSLINKRVVMPAYRGGPYHGETRKCAIGILIKDEHYRPQFEGQSLRDCLIGRESSKSKSYYDCGLITALELSDIDVNHSYDLLNTLQILHDTEFHFDDDEELRIALMCAARKFNLEYDCVRKAS